MRMCMKKKINTRGKLGRGLVWTYQDSSRRKRWIVLVVPVIPKGGVAF